MPAVTDLSANSTDAANSVFNDADWFSLEQSLKDGNVIPIIGPDALLVEFDTADGSTQIQPFYNLVAADLLKAFGLQPRTMPRDLTTPPNEPETASEHLNPAGGDVKIPVVAYHV